MPLYSLSATFIHSVPHFSPASCKARQLLQQITAVQQQKLKLLYRLHTRVVLFFFHNLHCSPTFNSFWFLDMCLVLSEWSFATAVL